jgi:hypothetical protein
MKRIEHSVIASGFFTANFSERATGSFCLIVFTQIEYCSGYGRIILPWFATALCKVMFVAD